eukprot:6544998-Alexandrium_andersonii.AAC.1
MTNKRQHRVDTKPMGRPAGVAEQRESLHIRPHRGPPLLQTPPRPLPGHLPQGPVPNFPKQCLPIVTPRLAPCLAGRCRLPLPGCPGAGPGPP